MTVAWPFPDSSQKSPDNNVNEICKEFIERSLHGFEKYGVTTERADLDLQQWLTHLKEELMDAVVYIHRAKKELALNELTRINEQLGLYNDTNMSTTIVGNSVTIDITQYGAAMPVTDIISLSENDGITVSFGGDKDELKSGT